MERTVNLEQKTLINELIQGKELAKQLMNHLQPFSSPEKRNFLVGKILSSYEKALSMLKTSGTDQSKPFESPHSLDNTSPRSVIFDQDYSKHRDVFKKRKVLPRWTEQVKVCMGTGPEGPLEDGYSWRKYGQKDILGANHPRGYYRCTRRNAQGCLATKQVQRSDQDSSLFEVTYRGRHTCSRAPQLAMASANSLPKHGLKAENNDQFPTHEEQDQEEEKPKQPQATGLGVKTEDFDTNNIEDGRGIFQPFSFLSTPIESDNVGRDFFSDIVENGIAGPFSPPFVSPAGSESTSLSVSPWHNMSSFGLANNNVQTSESDLTDILSTPNSVTNSPIGDLDLTLDKVDLELDFPFDSPEFFSSCQCP
ncbi:putative WRKY transcription factor 46 [Morus notabilis]|uniref:Putative WRKY transcription factor 46 n=1 Tax=Morus notabilis TaxID=981085 RepID=W9RNA2_9ROSA|nr:probable WRKY transcription factor 46 [Morus notabilis]EXB62209.1 putative WRKY transcription factor 46 [Morus notabilis]